ncbi:MAG TPA: hypothetical protein VLE43_13365, partial [Candidatus Saccharimonadia bacterium]|nr:hypothetical protein [Candidatus Saccharimonadia bacterium]
MKFSSAQSGRLARHQEPVFPSYDDALSLMKQPTPHGALKAKLENLWRTPVVDNGAFLSGKRPHEAASPTLG